MIRKQKMTEIKEVEKIIGIEFKNKLLLREALTHRSYINENPSWPVPNNERLEFLGDAVLELAVTDSLFEKYPDNDEGRLTSIRAALVNHVMLSRVANKIGIDKYLFLSKGETNGIDKAKEVIIGNVIEALIGAIYLDKGYEEASKFVERFILDSLENIVEEELYLDPKSSLQEIVQGDMKLTPNYKILEESGPDHQKEFIVGVFFGDDLFSEGKGTSKQEAERSAAENALKKIEKENKNE